MAGDPSGIVRGERVMGASGEDGYFPRGSSVLRRVHGARIVGTSYGQRALLLQATHPVAFEGLIGNTGGLAAPFQRLAHTAKTMEKVFFGTRAEADRETERVRRLHARIRWDEHRADEPEFLLWILACIADSSQTVYERVLRRLSDDEREAFWQDYVLVGEMFGLDRAHAPADYAGYRAYMRERLASDELRVVPEAQEIGLKVAFDLPVPTHRQPGLAVINFLVLGLLPQRVRELYGLPWGRERQVAFDGLVAALRLSARVAPARLRRGSSGADYELVAKTERRRLRDAA